MIRLVLSLTLLLCPAALPAQGWDWPEADFDGLYSGFSPRFHDPDKPRFAPDGSVQRPSDPGRPVYFGAFTLLPDGRVCLSNGAQVSGCNLYMRDGWMRMRVSESRGRLPFRFELGVGN